ncbi:hypothetical protein [Methanolobus profundi]|nr:hypothetical protein [Methanolobus profundi]
MGSGSHRAIPFAGWSAQKPVHYFRSMVCIVSGMISVTVRWVLTLI